LFQNKFTASGSALPEVETALVIVVAPAPQLNAVHGRFAAKSIRIDVVEFHKPALIAPVSTEPDERAATEIPHPHLRA